MIVLTGICIAFPTLMAVWMFFMPRSPVYLLSKGDKEAAKKSLQFFRGGSSVDVDEELKEIESSVQERSSIGSVSVKTLFTDRRYSKPLGIVLVLMALQQLSGINYILSYSVLIFKVRLTKTNLENIPLKNRNLAPQLTSAPVQC